MIKTMNYQEAAQYLESFIDYERLENLNYKESFKLERIQAFLGQLDNPQESLRCIHIAGSKGKGSTAAFISYILKESCFKVGLYTSPHLSTFRERIRILEPGQNNGEVFEGLISKKDLIRYVEELFPVIEKFEKTSEFAPLTFFEVYTAFALLYFKEKKVDFAVLETGLGGRLDATNVVNPLVCVISPISFEHMYLLGSTLEAIAFEKTGIIKRAGQLVVSAPQEKEVDLVIEDRCAEFDAELYKVGADINFKERDCNQEYQMFDIEGLQDTYDKLKINLLGSHQLINAATAIGTVELLRNFDIIISEDEIRRGLEKTYWPGRFEIVKKEPFIVLDGAQNVASAKALILVFNKVFGSTDKILVLGICKDKDIEGVCSVLGDFADKIILTKTDNPRAADPNTLSKFIKKDKIISVTSNVTEAMNLAKDIAKRQTAILVAGSLYLVGEARKLCLN
jgi:dihydrofolate synthase/folylpolyglutamate synthase